MTVWWNLFWKFRIEYLKHVMKCQNVILTLHFTLQDENIWKRKMWRESQNKDQDTPVFSTFGYLASTWQCANQTNVQSYSEYSQILRQNTLLDWQDTQW